MGDDDRRRRYSSEGRISGLPDELLLDILVRLGAARAAARTSVLSRRWRHVWAHIPELILDGGPDALPSLPASFLDIVDAALDTHAAPTVQRLLIAVSDAYAYSDTLRSLQLGMCNSSQVEVIAPRLEKLFVYDTFIGRTMSYKLSELFWTGGNANGSHQFCFDVVSRHLRLLEIVGLRSITKSLMQQFDEVDELKLFMFIPKGTEGYQSFLNQIKKLPVCKTLNVSLLDFNHHGLAPTLLHLLKTCNSTTKEVYVQLIPHDYQQYSCPSSCPCRLPESQMVDVITLSSLEEVTICSHSKSYEELEFVQQLSKCNAASLKKLVTVHDNERFRVHLENNEVTEKIRSLYPHQMLK